MFVHSNLCNSFNFYEEEAAEVKHLITKLGKKACGRTGRCQGLEESPPTCFLFCFDLDGKDNY